MPRGFGPQFAQPVELGLCAIVKNEAHRLATCLGSVRDFVDEMVVVDTGSTDNTIAIARKCGARVAAFTWCDDFAAARNFALSLSRAQWILVLDADEELLPDIKPILREAIRRPDCLAVTLVRQEVGGPTPYSLVSRLFRRHPDLVFSGIYHESIDAGVERCMSQNSRWQIFQAPGIALKHYGYRPAEITAGQKYDLARRLMHRHLERYPEDGYMYGKLGALYVQLGDVLSVSGAVSGDLERGLTLLVEGLSRARHPLVLFEIYYHLGFGLGKFPDRRQLAEERYRQALDCDVPDIVKLPAWNNLGTLLLESGCTEEAIAALRQVTAIDPSFAPGHYNLGIALKVSGDLAGAIDAYQQAIAGDAGHADAFQNLGVALMHVGCIDESRAAFHRALELHRIQGKSDRALALERGLLDLGLL